MAAGAMSMIFDETWYLERYPDVANAVREGLIASAQAHFQAHGVNEQRHPSPIHAARSAKLASLKCPPLGGKSVLHVGCGEGDLCLQARFDGASRVIGVDPRTEFIDTAIDNISKDPERICRLDFFNSLAEICGDDTFDVIICTSIARGNVNYYNILPLLLEQLNHQGVLVFEGVTTHRPGSACNSMRKLSEKDHIFDFPRILNAIEPNPFKIITLSPVEINSIEHHTVIHAEKLRPIVFILAGKSHSGKTTASRIFKKSGVRTVMIDSHIETLAKHGDSSRPLVSLIQNNYKSDSLYMLYEKIFLAGMLGVLCQDIIDHLKEMPSDLTIVEGAIGLTEPARRAIRDAFEANGFFVWVADSNPF